MLRKISFGLLCMAASLNANSTDIIENNLMPIQGITFDYDLVPNQPQIFTNYMFWMVEANCKITSQDESDDLQISALAKKGKINNIPLSAGQSIQITVHSRENLKIAADSGAKVEIINLGQHTVKASCSA